MPKVRGTASMEFEVDFYALSGLMANEVDRVFGSDAYLKGNGLWHDDSQGHYKGQTFVRDLSDEEVVLFNALYVVRNHFNNTYYNNRRK